MPHQLGPAFHAAGGRSFAWIKSDPSCYATMFRNWVSPATARHAVSTGAAFAPVINATASDIV